MDVALVVLFLGVLIFLGNLFGRIFALTKIPDLLLLIGIGILAGPVLGLVTPEEFGIAGPLFTTVTLAVILFEGGLHLKVATIRSAFRGTIELSLVSFGATMIISAGILVYLHLLEPLPALMLGAAVGGTSSAVVIPMIEYLNLGKESSAILALESAITDVLCIVVLLAFLDIYQIGELNVPYVAARFASSFIVAGIIGVSGGIAWSVLYHRLKTIRSIFLTPAFVFIIYGVATLLGFSGAIAALAFGITLGNLNSFSIVRWIPAAHVTQVELTPHEVTFLSQLVQLLKTFFFIYLGLSIILSDIDALEIGLMIVLVLIVARLAIVRFALPKSIPAWDASITAVMIPKGLAGAVLAAIPLQMGVRGGLFIETTTYGIILFSIMICSFLVLLLDKTMVKRVYGWVFRDFGKPVEEEPPPPS